LALIRSHNIKELSQQDLQDILLGATILGAGGGGDIEEGKALISQAHDAGKKFRLRSIGEVPDDALICTPYLLGAISPMTAEEELEYGGLDRSDTQHIMIAYKEFQAYLGRTFYGTTACEMGGSNTAVAFYCAAMHDHFIIDADPAGRAVPEITHSTYYFDGLPASPIFAANEFGETFIINNVKDDQRAETLVRALCQVSRNDIAAIDHALEMRVLKNTLIPGTISKALSLGRMWRESQTQSNLPEIMAKAGGGLVAFKGLVNNVEYRTVDGFTKGTIEIDGIKNYTGQTFKIMVKNENLVGWLNSQVRVTIPDLICLFDTTNGQPISNPDVCVGQQVAVVLLPAPVEFTSAKALSVFGPSYAGIDETYQPIVNR